MDTLHADETPKVHEEFSKIHHTHLGPILGVLIVVLFLIFAGLWVWGGMLAQQAVAPASQERAIVNHEPETPRAVADVEILEATSPSDELDAIDADLGSTKLDALDTELDTATTEMNDIQLQ